MIEVWLQAWDQDVSDGYLCFQCGEAVGTPHLHLNILDAYLSFTCYCSEGCAIQVIQDRGYTVVPKPVEVAS